MKLLFVNLRKTIYLLLGFINDILKLKRPLIHILCYHSLATDKWAFSVDTNEFEKQINFLKTKFDFITLADLSNYLDGKKRISRPSVILNFDDGYRDILKVKPLLKTLHIKPTVFVLADTKNANYKELGTKRNFLSRNEILKLKDDGWEIGSHTSTHPDMNLLNDKQIEKEIIGSKSKLEKQLGFPISYIAFPKGRYNQKILESVKRAGYDLALTMDDIIINDETNKYLIPRIGVDRTHTMAEFKTISVKPNILIRKFLKSLNYGK